MRNIKFRLWSKVAQCIIEWKDVERKPHTIFDNSRWIPMQFTGLKDCKGVEIYEGDILKGRSDYKYKIVWEVCEFICYHLDSGYRWGRLSRLNDLDMSDIFLNIEVIGNIYEEQK
jgi:hypothetical protein